MDFQYTQKHGSWLNMAEIEFSVFGKECLDRRIADLHALTNEIGTWESQRTKNTPRVIWQFTTENAISYQFRRTGVIENLLPWATDIGVVLRSAHLGNTERTVRPAVSLVFSSTSR